MPFAASWKEDLEMILSEVSQRQTSYVIASMWNLMKMMQKTSKTETNLQI